MVLLTIATLRTPIAAQTEQPEGTISGTVIDAQTKEPLTGATVSIPALHIGAITKLNGTYIIHNVPAGKHKVEAKLLGYTTISRTVTTTGSGDVKEDYALTVSPLQGQEVVVRGLNGEVDLHKLGNTIGYVGGGQIAQENTPAAIDALEGRVPGVVVQKNSGAVGAGSYITIRGRHTISGSSEPLYVVDGVVIDNSYIFDTWGQSGSVQMSNRATDIDPSEIESVQVLKGASAAALYGSLAANGVVIITTKRGGIGTSDKPATVTYSSSYQTDQRVGKYNLQTHFRQTPGSNTSWGAQLPADTTTYNQADVPFRTAGSYIQSLTVSGGIPAITYLINGTLQNLEGVVKNSGLDDRSVRVNLGVNILPNLSIQANSNYINRSNDLPQEGSNTSGILLDALRTPPEFNNEVYLNPDGTQHRFANYDNPIWTQNFNKFTQTESRFLHSSDAKWSFEDWLVLNARLGYDRYALSDFERLDPQSATTGRQGRITHLQSNSTNVNFDMSATGTYRPTDDMSFQLMIGGQTLWANSDMQRLQADQTLGFYDEINDGASKTATSLRGETKTVGMFAQLTASLFDKLTLTGALRRDGSSTFGANNKFHNYPKFGFSYDLDKEEFMQSLKGTLDKVTLRGSYGEAGSPSLPGPYATNVLYGSNGFGDPWDRSTSASRGGFLGIRQGGGTEQEEVQYGNPNISPEISIEREIGLDLGLIDNRIALSATFYHTNVDDMILAVPVPSSTGFDYSLKNSGTMWNEGFEYALTVIPYRTDDFTWTTTANYYRNYNLVTSLAPGVDFVKMYGFVGIENIAMVGRPIGVFYGLGYLHKSDGSIATTTGVADDPFGNDFKGAPIIDPNPRVVGDPNPAHSFSWRNEFSLWKDLGFSFLLDGVQGQQIWNGTKGVLYHFGKHGETEDRNDPWYFQGQPVIDNTTGKQVTREEYYREYANSFIYDIEEPVIEDGSFVKLREVALSYNWHGLQDWKISNVALTLTARNLITWTKYTGFDPEINTFGQSESRGFDYFTIPQSRSYRFGITLTY
jgi:TonB-linked SusC/RagA family outer membrane protein